MENLDNSTKEQLLKEISQLKAKVSKLEKSELKSSLWLDNSPVCTKIVDLDFNLQYMSSSGVKELNIDDITKFYGKPYPLHFYPDSFKIPMVKNLKKTKETGEIITQEAPINDINGKVLWYHSTIVPVNDEKGELDYLMVVSLETTDRKTIEKELNESLSLLSSIINSPDNIIMFALDVNYNYLSFNQAHVKEMKFIYDADIEVGKFIFSFIPNKEDTQKAEINYKRVLKGEQFIEIQEYGDADNRFWYELIFNPIYDDSKNVSGLTVFVTNITERKQAEEKLRESKENFQQVVSNITIAIWRADIGEDGTFENQYTSPVFDKLLGLPAGDSTNNWDKHLSYVKPEYLERVNTAFREAIESPEKLIDIDFEVLKDNGQTAWFNSKGRCFEKDGKLRIFGSTADITESKKTERELAKHREYLEEMVNERTIEINEKNKKLDDALKVFVGRETTIRNLQDRIKALGGK